MFPTHEAALARSTSRGRATSQTATRWECFAATAPLWHCAGWPAAKQQTLLQPELSCTVPGTPKHGTAAAQIDTCHCFTSTCHQRSLTCCKTTGHLPALPRAPSYVLQRSVVVQPCERRDVLRRDGGRKLLQHPRIRVGRACHNHHLHTGYECQMCQQCQTCQPLGIYSRLAWDASLCRGCLHLLKPCNRSRHAAQ
jgi:hypothetical protein